MAPKGQRPRGHGPDDQRNALAAKIAPLRDRRSGRRGNLSEGENIILTYRRNFILVFCFLVFFQGDVFGQSNETKLLEYSYSGAGKPGTSGQEFLKVMAHHEVQKVLLEVASEPRTAAFLEDRLKGTDVTSETLQTLRLIRRDQGAYVLAFSLFTNTDLNKIRSVAEVEGRSLAAALLVRRAEIENILARNPQPGVEGKARAFIILGYASLDNDGLNLVKKRGYLAVPEKGTYLPSASQIGGGGSLRGIYWGSHSAHEMISVTSFGDHYSVPRIALPDIFFSLESSLGQMEAPESLKSKFCTAVYALVRRRAGMIMLALREGEKNVKQLAEASSLTEAETKKLLDLLLELQYVSGANDLYRSVIPIFDERDEPMVRDLRRLGQEVMVNWLDGHYKALSQHLSDLSPRRSGVPLSEGFYDIWHYIFGIANRELVAEGLFADPYDDKRLFKGFIPAVYLLGVLQGPI